MVMMFLSGHGDGAAAFGNGATDMLELDGRVEDAVAVGQQMIQSAQNRCRSQMEGRLR